MAISSDCNRKEKFHMAQPKRSRIENWKQALDRLRKGKGDHTAKDYAPYITIHDFSSVGRVSRTKYAGRAMHLMSDLETGCLRELQWAGAINIFDQVALADFKNCNVEKTVEIARKMGVDHSLHKRDQSPSVMTTDFVAKYLFPGNPPAEKLHAFAVKPTSAVRIDRKTSSGVQREAERTIEKLEIERRFWASENVKWSLVTSDDINPTRISNIEFFLSATRPSWLHNQADQILHLLSQADRNTRVIDLRSRSSSLNAHFSKPKNIVDSLRWLICERQLDFNLTIPFGVHCRVEDFELIKPVN